MISEPLSAIPTDVNTDAARRRVSGSMPDGNCWVF